VTRRRKRQWKHPSRDVILFIFGILGIVYETAFDNVDRPSLLVLFAAMVGLPAFLRSDERHKDDPEIEPPSKTAALRSEVDE